MPPRVWVFARKVSDFVFGGRRGENMARGGLFTYFSGPAHAEYAGVLRHLRGFVVADGVGIYFCNR